MQLSSTPIEEYVVQGRCIYVKREDLCAPPPYPPLGKLRGLASVVDDFLAQGFLTIGCWDTRVSKLGIGLAAAMQDVDGGKALFCYPQLKGRPVPSNAIESERLGAEVIPMRGNHVSICVAQARKIIEDRGGKMLPFGLECEAAVSAVEQEARLIPHDLVSGGTLVVSCGSGVTVSGLIRGLPCKPDQITGLSSGRSVANLQRCIRKHVGGIPSNLQLVPALVPYDMALEVDCPFPSHPNYDLKAWQYMIEHLGEMKDPVLFWNIGA